MYFDFRARIKMFCQLKLVLFGRKCRKKGCHHLLILLQIILDHVIREKSAKTEETIH